VEEEARAKSAQPFHLRPLRILCILCAKKSFHFGRDLHMEFSFMKREHPHGLHPRERVARHLDRLVDSHQVRRVGATSAAGLQSASAAASHSRR